MILKKEYQKLHIIQLRLISVYKYLTSICTSQPFLRFTVLKGSIVFLHPWGFRFAWPFEQQQIRFSRYEQQFNGHFQRAPSFMPQWEFVRILLNISINLCKSPRVKLHHFYEIRHRLSSIWLSMCSIGGQYLQHVLVSRARERPRRPSSLKRSKETEIRYRKSQ